MSGPNLGSLITTDEQRDAIHVAVCPVIAGEIVAPGDRVGFIDAVKFTIGHTQNTIGIVDPFLKNMVYPGEKCWMILYPNTITGLRHQWAHPAFKEQEYTVVDVQESEKWLRHWAATKGIEYGQLLHDITTSQYDGERYITAQGVDMHGYEGPGTEEEFWRHAEAVTGTEISEEQRSKTHFSCSC